MNYFIEIDSGQNIVDLYCDALGFPAPPANAIPVTPEQGEILRRGFSQYQYIGVEIVLKQDLLFKKAKEDRSSDITSCCNAACVTGVVSSALGTPHLYPSKVLDQQNLNASVVSSLLPGNTAGWTTQHMCQEVATGAWAYRPHNAAQIQQAGSDVKAGILTNLVRHSELQAQIAAITPASNSQVDIDAAMVALNAVVW